MVYSFHASSHLSRINKSRSYTSIDRSIDLSTNQFLLLVIDRSIDIKSPSTTPSHIIPINQASKRFAECEECNSYTYTDRRGSLIRLSVHPIQPSTDPISLPPYPSHLTHPPLRPPPHSNSTQLHSPLKRCPKQTADSTKTQKMSIR